MTQPAPTRSDRDRPPDRVAVVVEDDADARAAIDSLLRSVGIETRLFASAAELLAGPMPPGAACLVADVVMPGLTGLELQARLAERRCIVPIVFVTGYADVPMAVRAVQAGALDMLVKPFRDQALLDAVEQAFARHRELREAESALDDLRARLASLTPREREVMRRVAQGRLNKQIAAEFEIAEITVKVHRASMLRKMQARTVAELVRMAAALERDGD
ncbi:response regulator transcription factor [Albimonas pacifica]|uniref:Two component transcriptional regulator, LuxR family n=1 Tax=Albimonas pacifica TaxID=1114924 RepID=A0A1I3GYK2_9RHOB|nr:response regulator [Albimonas pacifica]SFI28519.1 two component transcriptional regulator, LuxR family [Albimonas pacifica]